MNTRTSHGVILAAIACSFLGSSIAVAHEHTKTVRVNCSHGQTIKKALGRGDEREPLVVLIRGVCNETVTIDRSDVTLRGEAGFGGGINGPDPVLDTLTVTARQVAIEELVISGGRNGVLLSNAADLTIRGTTVQSGRTGIVATGSSNVLIDASTVKLNPRDGVSYDSSMATIINSTVSQNGRFGIFVGTGAAARIGINIRNEAAGNTISQNGASGVSVGFGGSALIGNNSITLNGADLASTAGRSGISVVQATADIVGGNTIADNTGSGIFVRSGTVEIGNQSFDFSSVNTITGNGDAASSGGVFGFLGAAIVIRDAVISGNRGYGVGLTMRSQAQLINSQIQDNVSAGVPTAAGDGIRLALGSGLFLSTPASTSSGNAGAGVLCTDLETSLANPASIIVAGNAVPGTPGCTGF